MEGRHGRHTLVRLPRSPVEGIPAYRSVPMTAIGQRYPATGPAQPGLDLLTAGPAHLQATNVSAWFGSNKVLERVSLEMEPRKVIALIGPSGCGKSTFLRILNRMHELVPTAALSGSVELDGIDVYGPVLKVTETRLKVGMVFQKPNPFPAMSIYDNVLAGLKLTGARADQDQRDQLVHD